MGRRATVKKVDAEESISDVPESQNIAEQKRTRGKKTTDTGTKEVEEALLPKRTRTKPSVVELSKEENEGSQKRGRGRNKNNDLKKEDEVSLPKKSKVKANGTKKSKMNEKDTKKDEMNGEEDIDGESRPKRTRGRPAKNIEKMDDEENETQNKSNGDVKIKEEKDKDDKKNQKQLKRKLTIKKEIEDDAEDESPPKRTKRKSNIKKEEKEDDEADEEEKKKSGKDKKATKKSTSKKKSEKKPETEKKAIERSVVKKGLAAVDGVCPIAATSHVFIENGDIWDCMLNQTNIQFNNNKYYIIQLLKDDNKDTYSVWMHWGRVGLPGQNCLKPFGGNLDKAKDSFKKKFSDKTKNDWDERDLFEKVFGKYDLLKMDYSGEDETDNLKKEKEETVDKPRKKVESKLHAQIKALIELICDVKAMEDAVVEMKYDAKKAPLGKLTSDQVKAGYAALKEIESIILKTAENHSNKDLLEACNAFYTRIPHYFGMKVPPMIRTNKEIQDKLTLLQALGDIQAAMNIINQPLDENKHPVDQHYEGLNCELHALDKAESKYQLLEKYLLSTHGKTHSMYKIKVLEIFEANKSSEASRFKDVGNRMLLWHGSRLTNWAGILSQGLRIAPPEAPTTGYMFGKGIYFADMSSKSANYCMPSYQNKTGLLVLCDVSLGKCNELLNADYNGHKLPKDCHSVKGLGQTAPVSKNFVTIDDGVVLPMGPGVDTKVDNKSGFTLQYNEYIVYDVSQVKIKYLMKVEFVFK